MNAAQFTCARHFAAWIGLTPRQHSSGGKTRLHGISRQGNERLRQLLVVGAMAVTGAAKPGSARSRRWLMARIVRAMMTSGKAYRKSMPA